MTKPKTFKQKFSNGFMNVFAIAVTLMPLLSMGTWTYATFYNDDRKVYELEQLVSPEVEPFREPLVSVTFDDGWQSVYTQGTAVLEKYKIPTTQYVLTGEEKDTAYMTFAQMASLQKAGHEIGVHGVDHSNLPTLNDERLSFELTSSKKTLGEKKLIGSTVHFASPFNAYDQRTVNAIAEQYYSHRNTDANLTTVGPEDINLKSSLKRYQIIAYSVMNTTTDDQLRAAISYAKANNGWFVLVYHQIDESNTKYAVSPKAFDRQMKIIKDSGVKTPTVGGVLSQLEVEGEI
jgi:peptidoglycan/xylan/chitin deacetylase (PgdA/CDA1 family)